MNTQKGRRDHYLPQGYLRGFIDPARENESQPLWKLDVPSKQWSELEAPFVVEGSVAGSAADAIQHPDTTLYFPMCWQVCLFGSRSRFDRGTDKLDSHDMGVFRRKYRLFAQNFLISPTKLDDITDVCGTNGNSSGLKS